MSSVKYITVGNEEDGARLDRWFKERFPLSNHGYLQKLLRTGQIRVDGCRIKPGHRIKSGQVIRVPPLNLRLARQKTKVSKISLDLIQNLVADLQERIIFKDVHILAINKPGGLAVQGGTKTKEHLDAALDGLKFGERDRPRLVHRLDRDTSGVLLLARSKSASQWLTAAFKDRQTRKLYWALVSGSPREPNGIIDFAIDKSSSRHGERMTITKTGKVAKTVYRVVDRTGNRASWLVMEPRTGRTHQLRAHAALGLQTPIIGDGKYGGKRAFPVGLPYTNHMQLHARAIKLTNPNGKNIIIQAPVPEYMKANLKFLGFSESDKLAAFVEDDN